MDQLSYEHQSHKDITVIIPAMVLPSRIPFLMKTLSSVMNQDFEKDRYEIILISNSHIINDVIEPILADNIRVIVDTGASSLGTKLYTAITFSKGDIISFCEDDDELYPGALSYIFEKFNKRPIDYLHVNYDTIDRDSKKISVPTHMSRQKRAHKLRFVEFDYTIGIPLMSMITKSGALGNVSCVSVRAAFIKKYLFLLKDLNYGIDCMLFFIPLVFHAKMAMSGEKFTRYRIHQQNTSKNMMLNQHKKDDGKFLTMHEIINRVNYLRGTKQGFAVNKLLEVFTIETELITEITLNESPRRYILNMLIKLIHTSGLKNGLAEESFLIKSVLYLISKKAMSMAVSYIHRG